MNFIKIFSLILLISNSANAIRKVNINQTFSVNSSNDSLNTEISIFIQNPSQASQTITASNLNISVASMQSAFLMGFPIFFVVGSTTKYCSMRIITMTNSSTPGTSVDCSSTTGLVIAPGQSAILSLIMMPSGLPNNNQTLPNLGNLPSSTSATSVSSQRYGGILSLNGFINIDYTTPSQRNLHGFLTASGSTIANGKITSFNINNQRPF